MQYTLISPFEILWNFQGAGANIYYYGLGCGGFFVGVVVVRD